MSSEPPAVEAPDPLRAQLKHFFGFEHFQVGQRAVIEDVLAGKPTIAVMPTGGGKSLCYQLPALILDGLTLVVSPLISLMKDQVDGLRARGIAADYINSSQSDTEQRAALERIRNRESQLVYVAPERFRSHTFCATLRRVPIQLFAIDEAHCISRWGHDFRPEYARLGETIADLKPERLLACTATATPQVQRDILRTLNIEQAAQHIAGFLRENLFLELRACKTERAREQQLLSFLASDMGRRGALILYASTRKRVEHFAQLIGQKIGARHVVAYHGGMPEKQRTVAQDRFMSGEARIAVATNAFGMGVDRADVRAVVHLDLPRTVEGYYQEVGRAGRDRKPAHCLLLYGSGDTRVHERLIDLSHPTAEAFDVIWRALCAADPQWGLSTMQIEEAARSSGHDAMVEPVLRHLARVQAVRSDASGQYYAHPDAPRDFRALGIPLADIEAHREQELDRHGLMRMLAYHPGCRHAYILDYFGEGLQRACPGCDRCSGLSPQGEASVLRGEPSPAELVIVQKALAGVARGEGRWGLRKVAAMLVGDAPRAGYAAQQLSTFGLLKSLGLDTCIDLLQVFVDQRLCEVTTGRYPLLRLRPEGWAVMQGKRPLGFRPSPHLLGGPRARPAQSAARTRSSGRTTSVPLHGADATLYEELRRFRLQLAQSRGLPAFRIFSDRTLEALALQRPTDQHSFLNVAGLGPGKWADFGPALIALFS